MNDGLILNSLRLLPRRLQKFLYYRFLAARRQRFASAFEAAPLRLEPGVRMRLAPMDTFHGEIALFGIYEDEVSKGIHDLAIREGGLLVDVGANYGYFSLLWCAAAAGNRAHAIEASPRNLAPLRDNILRNQMTERITMHEWAASNKEGTVTFDVTSTEETGWGGITLSGSGDTVQVPARRLDEAFQGQDIAVLKIDCEGADALVLEGAAGLLTEKRIRHVFFEENLRRQEALGIAPGEGVRRLEAHGFLCQQLGTESLIRNYYARPA